MIGIESVKKYFGKSKNEQWSCDESSPWVLSLDLKPVKCSVQESIFYIKHGYLQSFYLIKLQLVQRTSSLVICRVTDLWRWEIEKNTKNHLSLTIDLPELSLGCVLMTFDVGRLFNSSTLVDFFKCIGEFVVFAFLSEFLHDPNLDEIEVFVKDSSLLENCIFSLRSCFILFLTGVFSVLSFLFTSRDFLDIFGLELSAKVFTKNNNISKQIKFK